MTTTKPFQLGSVSTGTLHTQDLLPAFEQALIHLGGRPLTSTDLHVCSQTALVEALHQELNGLCPPFVYFGPAKGAFEDDGADFGFWPDWDALETAIYTTHNKENSPVGEYIMEEFSAIVAVADDQTTVMELDRQVIWSTV